MSEYPHILIAVDIHPNTAPEIPDRAIQFAKQQQAKITLLHVVEHLPVYGVAAAYTAVVGIEQELVEESKMALKQLKEKFGIPDADIIVEQGSPKNLIIEQAKKLKADLIIVGSHGRHGIGLLLGSTANGVLHHAPCDVLAMRLQ